MPDIPVQGQCPVDAAKASLLSPFFFKAAVQTVTRSLLYGILSYTLYYAHQPQHDMNRPRIYCFKKNKDPFHEGKE